jgi:hypothetical protein
MKILRRGNPMSKTKLSRVYADQHKVITDAAKKRETTFQALLRRVIKVGIKMMQLEESK